MSKVASPNRAMRRKANKDIRLAQKIISNHQKHNPTKSPIPIATLKARGFIINDVVAMDAALPQSNFPWIFENENIKYKGRKIVNVEDVATDSELERYTAQAPRTGANPQYSAIRNDIKANGYSLTELPIAVRVIEDEDGTDHYVILDGRTRLEILEGEGVTTIVVDVFEIDKDGDADRTSLIYNRYRKPYGEGSTTDIEQCILRLDAIGQLGLKFKLKNLLVKDPVKLKERMDEAGVMIEKEANALSNNKLKPDQVAQIHANVINSFRTDKTILIRKFNNGGSLKEFCDKMGYPSNDRRKVITFSGTELAVGKLAEAIFNQREWLEEDENRVIYIILYCGKPNPTDPEGSWEKATVGTFMNKWEEFSKWCGNIANNPQIKLLGAIPQIRSLNSKYPMDKIHYF